MGLKERPEGSLADLCAELQAWAEDRFSESGDDCFDRAAKYVSEIGCRCRLIEAKLDTTIAGLESYLQARR